MVHIIKEIKPEIDNLSEKKKTDLEELTGEILKIFKEESIYLIFQ